MNATQASRNVKLAGSSITLPSLTAPMLKKTADTVNNTHPTKARAQDDRGRNSIPAGGSASPMTCVRLTPMRYDSSFRADQP